MDWTQIVVALMQLLGPVAIIWYRRRKRGRQRLNASTSPTGLVTPWLREGEGRATAAEQRISFAIAMLVMLISSLVLLNMLQELPVEGKAAFLIGFGVCVAMTLATIAATRLDILFVVTGYSAFTTAAVALVPTLQSPDFKPATTSIVTLLLLALAAVSHAVGSPSKASARLFAFRSGLRSWLRSATWPLMALIGTVTVVYYGARYVRGISSEPYVNQHQLSLAAKGVLAQVPANLRSVTTLYRAASESSLNEDYESSFADVFARMASLADREQLGAVIRERLHIDSEAHEPRSGLTSEQTEQALIQYLARNRFPDASAPVQPVNEDYFAPWRWFTDRNLAADPVAARKRIMEVRAGWLYPVELAPRRPKLEVNSFTVRDRFREFRATSQLFADAKTPGSSPNTQWEMPGEFGSSLSKERAEATIGSYPDPGDAVTSGLIRAQLKLPQTEEMGLAFWEYTRVVSDEFPQAATLLEGLLRLEPQERRLVRSLLFVRKADGKMAVDEPTAEAIARLADPAYDLDRAALRAITAENFDAQVRQGKVPSNEMLDNDALRRLQAMFGGPTGERIANRVAANLQAVVGDGVVQWCASLLSVPGEIRRQVASPLENPVAAAWEAMLGGAEDPALVPMLRRMLALEREDRERLLTEVALDDLYGTPRIGKPGRYQFGRLYDSMPILAWLVICFVGLLLAVPCYWLGLGLSKLLVLRDRALNVANEATFDLDRRSTDAVAVPDAPLSLTGQVEAVTKLKALARRGFGTIGLVGRRGIGKTRVLRALLEQLRTDELDGQMNVGVWSGPGSMWAGQCC